MKRFFRWFCSTSRARLLCLAATTVMFAGCTHHTSAEFATASSLPEGKRKPDAIVVDPTSSPPPTKSLGHTDDHIVTLQSPAAERDALKTVKLFFDGVVRENLYLMERVMKSSLIVSNTSSTRRLHYRYLWRRRFRQAPQSF